ncbi:nucleotide sugar dehydrogenase [Chryseobacterium sp.]|uniref:nucleotide sugar dehydrogenase n=1 Tax=Chryseobacterium sp. TaxID=1871047 RepID=UPI0011CC3F60|nr:nucleotide sugar dehydrogenase [Chryseobacterium sp.]TXF77516.1 nucleotide sugar dehydrogenase [Chryseobacterium sp.]
MHHAIAVIGLGYVGLPLARLFAERYGVVGFDIDPRRIQELKQGRDSTGEISEGALNKVLLSHGPFSCFSKDKVSAVLSPDIGLYCSADPETLREANTFIVTVPTPVDKNNIPDLTYLYEASEIVGRVLKNGDLVIYESTVYPGVTEEECIPILERISGLKFNEDFYCGYSPERINPGDKEKTVEKIIKVTSGSTPESATIVDALYKTVITAGTHLVSSIKIAEACKVIENAQRDINIAFVNELSKIFSLMNLDTQEILSAASTKWNFLPFKPGLVGGHCIGVDPFFLADKAVKVGHYSELIFAARRVNDSMGLYVADQVLKAMIRKGMIIKGAEVLIMGFAYKENCADFRNTKVIDIIRTLEEYEIKVRTCDPLVNAAEVQKDFGIIVQTEIPEITDGDIKSSRSHSLTLKYDAVILAVAHEVYLDQDFRKYLKPHGVLYDVKGLIKQEVDGRL